MSFIPIFVSLIAGLLVYSIFFWNMILLSLILIFIIGFIIFYMFESLDYSSLHFVSSFWLFIFSEVVVFGSLLFCCLFFDYDYYTNLSSSLELPFLGCFLLLGSSFTVTFFHHLIGWNYSWICLVSTIILGLGFVILQVVELNEIIVNIFDTTFHASSLCTVGLHFSHVMIGLVGLFMLLFVGCEYFDIYRSSIIIWYWHFVDYVWLFVYTFVYVC